MKRFIKAAPATEAATIVLTASSFAQNADVRGTTLQIRGRARPPSRLILDQPTTEAPGRREPSNPIAGRERFPSAGL